MQKTDIEFTIKVSWEVQVDKRKSKGTEKRETENREKVRYTQIQNTTSITGKYEMAKELWNILWITKRLSQALEMP